MGKRLSPLSSVGGTYAFLPTHRATSIRPSGRMRDVLFPIDGDRAIAPDTRSDERCPESSRQRFDAPLLHARAVRLWASAGRPLSLAGDGAFLIHTGIKIWVIANHVRNIEPPPAWISQEHMRVTGACGATAWPVCRWCAGVDEKTRGHRPVAAPT